MDKQTDPLLSEHGGLLTTGYEYRFVNLPPRVILVVSANIELVWVMTNKETFVRPSDIILNAKQMFESNELKGIDVLWKEHCASTLRELMDGHLHEYTRFLQFPPKRENATELYEKLSRHKAFLNNFAHLNKDALKDAEYLTGRATTVITDQIFDSLCTDFIFELAKFFGFKA